MTKPTVTSYRPSKTVIGDGTSGKTRFAGRLRRWRSLIVIIISVLVVGVLSMLIRPTGNTIPLHPQNSEETGAMALTQILKERGVQVQTTGSVSSAVSQADANTTVFVYDAYFVDTSRYSDIVAAGANLVVVEPSVQTLRSLDLDLAIGNQEFSQNPSELVTAQCDDPDAQAANAIPVGSRGFVASADSDAIVCFAPETTGPFATSADGKVRLFSEPNALMNENLATAGNAALAIRALGEKENVVWLIPSRSQGEVGAEAPSMMDFLPPWFGTIMALAVAIVVFLAFWRGRRMGRLVTEPLPVVVRAAESTIGLGRMYRRSSEIGHAAQALRAGTALRCAQRLGVAPTAPGTAIASAVAHAINRPYEEIADLFLGSPPTNEAGLIALAQMLDRLESEVHAS